jgi:NADH-quinone oxidoreductase subunit F
MARFFMDFCQDESCGKCIPCREGTKRMLEILTNITKGKGKEGDIELLESMASVIKDASLCGLGQTAPNPVLSTIRYFRDEYVEHIRDKKCRAAVCSALFKSPCQHTCPIGMDIPSYIALIRDDRLTDAYRVLLKTNPFPSACGRVCDHKCMSKCRRGLLDEPVSIKFLKRYITDQAPRPEIKPVPVTRKEKIAVIGAGPAGLTCARDLALRGYRVTVFEELPTPGGMLSWGIPSYRLPREVLGKEIDDIRKLGVEIRCGIRVGRDLPWDAVNKDFDTVYLAPGAHKSQRMGVEGEDLKGVWGGVEFLRDYNMNEAAWTDGKKTLGAKVAVIGGGNSAIDAARTAKRLGAEVTILYRRLREDMPAAEEEIVAAEHEGIKIEYLIAPLRIVGTGGRASGIECLRQKLGDFDSSGRKRPVAIKGSEFTLALDTIIAAIGQTPDLTFVPKESGVTVNKWSCFDVATNGFASGTTNPKFFAGGDAVTGPSTVIKAIAAGHEAADDIDASIRKANGEPAWVPAPEEQIQIPFVIDEETEECPMAHMPELEASFRSANFQEVELGYAKELARKESTRCLRCDVEL